jgi:hypothetical protein
MVAAKALQAGLDSQLGRLALWSKVVFQKRMEYIFLLG